MGNNSDYANEKYLSKEEIKSISNIESNIFDIFNQNKNSDGLITVKELKNISKGLLSISVCKKIVKICGNKNGKLTKDDLIYFFALLSTDSFKAKLNFLLDFIFYKKNKLNKDKYIYKVLKYYQQSTVLINILLNNDLLQNFEVFQKGEVYNYIKNNFYNEINDYKLFDDENSEIKNINNEIENENNIINIYDKKFKYCNCLNNNKIQINFSNTNSNYKLNSKLKYKYLEKEFKRIENENEHIFPIILFENMLKEINVLQSLIDIIGNYLRQKSQKNFFNFDLFEELLSLLCIKTYIHIDDEDDENINKNKILDGLFELFSYPNDYITKTAFFLFIKSTKKNLSSSLINKLFVENKIEKYIYKNKFKEMIKYIINELLESFEHIKYLPYIFFNQNLENKKLEKNCIEILLKEKSINEYIIERIDYDEKFYIIDFKFWNKWNKLMNDTNINFEEFNDLKINTKKICYSGGRLKEGLVYLKDFIIFSPRMYKLFSKWYKFPESEEVERGRIALFEEEEEINTNINIKNLDNNNFDKKHKYNDNNNINSDTTEPTMPTSPQFKENENYVQNEDFFRNKNYEIEVFPVFLVFYKMEDLIKRGLNALSYLKEHMRKITKDKTNFKYNKFSKKHKIGYIIEQLQEYFENKLTPNTARLWIYYNDRLEILPYEDTLEKQGITNIAFVIIELKQNGLWQTEKLDINKKLLKERSAPLVGLLNVGNSCYMNSVLQIFFNIPQIKKIFVDQLKEEKSEDSQTNQFFWNFITSKNKRNNLLKNFLSLLISKWTETKKTLNPKSFKDICGEYNQAFKEYEQQDAYDFYTFLLDNLHEETNIKINHQIKNPELTDISEQDLADEYWANTVRNNASYFYALFMGQFQSKLICSKCKKEKIKYEPFNALNLPIPEEDKIIVKICLFRLPITLSPFYINKKDNNNSIRNKILSDMKTNEIRKKLIKIKNIHIDPYNEYNNSNSRINNSNKSKDLNKKKNNELGIQKINIKNERENINLNTEFFENEKKEKDFLKNEEEEIISNALIFNIPVRIKIEIDRNKKCQEIIDILKNMKELSLDNGNIYTEFIILNEDYNIINTEQIINNCIFPIKEIYIYELLSYEGIKKIFGYNDLQNNDDIIIKLNEQINIEPTQNKNNNKDIDMNIKNKSNQTLAINIERNNHIKVYNDDIHNNIKICSKDKQIKENLIEIIHRYKKDTNDNNNYLYIPKFEQIRTNKDFIILTNNNSIKPLHLYEIMWEKYMYFLNKPYNKFLWWKQDKNIEENLDIKYKKCSPFIIKIIQKSTFSCAFCPWYKFCTGCILSPQSNNYIDIDQNWIVIVEWCKEIVQNDLNNNNLLLRLYHSSYKNEINERENNYDKKTIYDCLQLFTQKEILKDILCENCNIKTTFTKELKIERLPEYLFIVFKRFKYISKYSTKIETLISFPFEDLKLDDYLMQKNKKNKKYDLYAVINHIGSLSQGHYFCNIKQGNKWIRYEDSYVEEDEDINVSNIYLLVYKSNNLDYYKHKKYDFYFNFLGLMNTAYRIYLSQYNFDHLFNYILNENEEIIEEYKINCQYYYGEPVDIDGQKGFLVNVYKNEDDEIYAKVKINKSFIDKKIDNIKIKETIKEEEKFDENFAKRNTAICSGCIII